LAWKSASRPVQYYNLVVALGRTSGVICFPCHYQRIIYAPLLKPAGREFHGPVGLFLLFVFFYFNDFSTLVETAVGAYGVWQDHCSAIRTSHQVGGFQCVVGAAPIAASFRQFTFWLWGHSLLLYMIPVKRADYSGEDRERQAFFMLVFPFLNMLP
jgi:hypothetical protein